MAGGCSAGAWIMGWLIDQQGFFILQHPAPQASKLLEDNLLVRHLALLPYIACQCRRNQISGGGINIPHVPRGAACQPERFLQRETSNLFQVLSHQDLR